MLFRSIAQVKCFPTGCHLHRVQRVVHLVVVRLSFFSAICQTVTSGPSYLSRNPVYHQVVFAILMFTTTFRTMYLLRTGEVSNRLPQEQRSTTARLFLSGAATFAFGFLIWNLDNVFCSNITRWKQAVGWPAAFLLEGELVPQCSARCR